MQFQAPNTPLPCKWIAKMHKNFSVFSWVLCKQTLRERKLVGEMRGRQVDICNFLYSAISFFPTQECYISQKCQLLREEDYVLFFNEDEERTLRWITFNSTVLLLQYCSTKALFTLVFLDIIKLLSWLYVILIVNRGNSEIMKTAYFHTLLQNLNVSLVRSWENSFLLYSFITLNHLTPLSPLTIPLSLAILTCLLNRRLKPLSKALALGGKRNALSLSHFLIFTPL